MTEEAIKKIKNLVNNEKILIGIVVALVAYIVILSFFPGLSLGNREKIYSIEIIKITGCEECFDLSSVSSSLIKTNVNIKNEKTLDYNSEEAKKLIERYGIEKIPVLIVTGKINMISLDENIFRIEKNAGVFDKPVPYLDLNSKKIEGLVDIKEIFDSSCVDCTSMSGIESQLEKLGIKIKDYEMVDSKSEQGKELISQNNVAYLPSLLVSKNINEYWWIFANIKNAFTENKDYYRFSEPLFPYKEISTGKIKGKVKFTYITDNSCLDCFNVSELKSAFQNLGVYVSSEEYADISSKEGKNLLVTYNITAVPTVILSEEISDYAKIKNVLEQVGSFVNNKYVFRKLDVLNVKYKNLENGG